MRDANGKSLCDSADSIIIATSAVQAYALLGGKDQAPRELSEFRVTNSTVFLHRDEAWMPHTTRAEWSELECFVAEERARSTWRFLLVATSSTFTVRTFFNFNLRFHNFCFVIDICFII